MSKGTARIAAKDIGAKLTVGQAGMVVKLARGKLAVVGLENSVTAIDAFVKEVFRYVDGELDSKGLQSAENVMLNVFKQEEGSTL